MGMGTSTTQAIVTAERLGLPLERVAIAYGDSSFPGNMLAGGSSADGLDRRRGDRGPACAGRASCSQLAGDDSPLAGLTADEVGGRDEGLCELRRPRAAGRATPQILDRRGRDEVTVVASASDPAEMQAYSMHSYGAIFCEVRVNAITGETRVDRVPRLLRLRAHHQPQDGREPVPRRHHHGPRARVDGRDQVRRAHRPDHEPEPRRISRARPPGRAGDRRDVDRHPRPVRTRWARVESARSGSPASAAAVANAVYNATGRRVRDLPITLDKLL